MDTLTFDAATLQNGQMITLTSGDTKVLLVRVDGELHALEGQCPHAGAELSQGVLCGGRVVCPWHHAAFEVVSGQRLEPPALRGLRRYPVRMNGETATISLEPVEPQKPPRTLAGQDQTAVIVGGGAAGYAAARCLHEGGYAGRVLLLSADAEAPYDRTALSKGYLSGKKERAQLGLGALEGVELMLGTRVLDVHPGAETLLLQGGDTLSYDELILAPGGEPRTLEVPGAELDGLFQLRTLHDADALKSALGAAGKVVVVGTGFIGMEGASSVAALEDRRRTVTVVGREDEVLGPLGPELGATLRALHQAKGTQFRLGAEVERFEGENGRVTAVRLRGGERLPADVVLLGLGVRPASELLPGELRGEGGGVRVDAQLLAAPHLRVCGDVAEFPWGGEHIRVEHWRVAEQHGMLAARALLGQRADTSGHVPFFWTQQFGKSVRSVGHAGGRDERVVWGDASSQNYLVWWIGAQGAGERVTAAAGLGRDAELAALEELMRTGRTPTAAEVRGGEFDLAARLA